MLHIRTNDEYQMHIHTSPYFQRGANDGTRSIKKNDLKGAE
jgi:hypothetical protein